MAEPFDHILSKYIEYARKAERISPNFYPPHELGRAVYSAKEQFGDTYTVDEYNQAMLEAEQHVYINYYNKFTRIPE